MLRTSHLQGTEDTIICAENMKTLRENIHFVTHCINVFYFVYFSAHKDIFDASDFHEHS